MIRKFRVKVEDETFQIEVEEIGAIGNPFSVTAPIEEIAAPVYRVEAQPKSVKVAAALGIITAPLPGKVSSLEVKPGDVLKRGDLLLLIEAMKMENEMFAPYDCTIKQAYVTVGQMVETGDRLLEIG
ncbi:MAG: biotin/lipoyl-binding protein [Coprothermobacterota bacterium]|nr:biotin/lipoyl-binding protein [Coprothermobacterota bacterium]